MLPPTHKSWYTLAPPLVTINAPVPSPVEFVLSDDCKVVNLPVLAVLAPMVVPFRLPPVTTALPVLKFVLTNVVTPAVVISALPVLKFVATALVNVPVPLKLPADSTPVPGLYVSDVLVNGTALAAATLPKIG